MKYIAGAKILERRVILLYIAKVGAPVTMPEILRLRGIPVVKRGELPAGGKKHYTSIATSTRHIMARLCSDGLVSVDREQFGFWSLRFILTPAGRQAAEETGEFISFINDLHGRVIRTLESRAGDIRDLAPLPAEVLPGTSAREAPAIPAKSPEPGSIPPVVQVKAPPKAPAASPAKPAPRPRALAPPKVVPHPPVISPRRPASRMLRCPNCQTEFPITSVKRQTDRHDSFACDCGTDLTDKALALIDADGAGAG